MADAAPAIIHPGSGAAPAAAPASAPQRMRVGDMTALLEQTPPPGQTYGRAQVVDAPEEPQWIADEIPGVGLDGQAQALSVPVDEFQRDPEVLEAQIVGPDGKTITWDEYQQLVQKWESTELHEELHDRLVSATVDGRKYSIPVREAVKGYQRARDYSNGMAEVAAGRRENERTRQGFLNVLNDMNEGQSFLRMVRALGKMQGFEQAAKQFAVEWDAERRMNPQQRALLARQRQLEHENYQLKMRAQQLQQVAQQQPQPNQQAAFIQHQLSQMIPIAAKKVGLEGSPLAQQLFELHLSQMIPTLNGELTTDFVMQVMQAAKEDHDRAVQQSLATMEQQKPKTPPVQRLPAAAPAANGTINPNGTPKRMRVSDMGKVLTGQMPR